MSDSPCRYCVIGSNLGHKLPLVPIVLMENLLIHDLAASTRALRGGLGHYKTQEHDGLKHRKNSCSPPLPAPVAHLLGGAVVPCDWGMCVTPLHLLCRHQASTELCNLPHRLGSCYFFPLPPPLIGFPSVTRSAPLCSPDQVVPNMKTLPFS